MSSDSWTIRRVLEWTAGDFDERGIEAPRLDAELLVAKALDTDRVGLYLDLDRPLGSVERLAIRSLVARRRDREPVAYILGHKDFYGHRFLVDESVLIPRPDTETLVEHALACIPSDATCRVADVGTGSGAVAVSIALARPLAVMTATDISEKAITVATTNAATHGVDARIDFVQTDLLEPGKLYDVIVSNPPYIASEAIRELQPEVRLHEPSTALDGGADGLEVVRSLLRVAESVMHTDGQLLLEIGSDQAQAVETIATENGWHVVATHKDLNRQDRVVQLRRA